MDAAPTLPAGRKLLFAVLPLVLLLVLVELALRVAVPASVVDELDRSRGFDAAARYLVPDPDVPGGWRTQIFGEPDREERIGPKGAALRVLLFGGSNTRGFPQQDLERQLDEAGLGDGRDYEVINLGREGYGSLRVLYLLEQSMVLQPDVVVIYSGHNEFIELGFRRELDERAGWSDGLLDTLSHLRTFELVRDAVSGDPAGLPPTNIDRVDPSQVEIPWELTQDVYARYRQNLADMCDIAHAGGAEVLLCTVVSNMLWMPRVWTPTTPLSEADAERHEQLYTSSFGPIPQRFRAGLWPVVRLRGTGWRTGGGQRSYADLPRLRPLLGALAENPRMTHLPADDPARVSLWYAPDRWDPAVGPVVDWYAEVVNSAPDAAERQQLGTARERLEQALAIVPDDPRALFMRAFIDWLLGERGQAVAEMRAAAVLDRSPNNGNDTSNGLVASVAAERPWVHFIDSAEVFRQRCPDELVSYEVMMDGCHLHPGARYVLMADLAEVIRELPLR